MTEGKRRTWQNIIIIGALILIGCGHAEYSGIKPSITYDIKGDVKDNCYINPNKSFRILIPVLLNAGAKVHDDQFPEGIWHVSMMDDFCEEYVVLENLFGTQDSSVDAWVDRKLTPMFKDAKYTLIDRKYVQTKYGQGVMLRWTQKEAAPCTAITFKNGKQVAGKPDAEIGFYLIKIDDYAYRFIYVNGPDLRLWGGGRATEEELVKFINGFEVINPSQKGK